MLAPILPNPTIPNSITFPCMEGIGP